MSLIFDLPDIKCRYLTDIGKWDSLEKLLKRPFEKCNVGTKNGSFYLPSSRMGSFRNTEIIFENRNQLNFLIQNKLEELFSKDFDYVEDLGFDINTKYKVLKYQENDFFKRHQDSIRSTLHYGTLLIFPPATDELEHKGGKLVFDDKEFESSSNNKWKAIILLCETYHEVEKIISGQRIVLKTELFFNENFDSDLDQDMHAEIYDCGLGFS